MNVLKCSLKVLLGVLFVDIINYFITVFLALGEARNVVSNIITIVMLILLVIVGFISNPFNSKICRCTIIPFLFVMTFVYLYCYNYGIVSYISYSTSIMDMFIIEDSSNIHALIIVPIIYTSMVALGGALRVKYKN